MRNLRARTGGFARWTPRNSGRRAQRAHKQKAICASTSYLGKERLVFSA